MLDRDETELDFYSRRAMEESHAAAAAPSPVVGATHRHMAAAYAARLRDEEESAASFEAFLKAIEDVDAQPPPASASDGPQDEAASPTG